MSELQNGSRRRKRVLSAEEKLQIWLQLLTGELTQRQAAERWIVDPTTIMRIRRVGREGVLTALASSKPGGGGRGVVGAELVAAGAEIARLEETVKEQAIELVALRGRRARAGRPRPSPGRGVGQGAAVGADRRGDGGGLGLPAGVWGAGPV